MTSYYFNCHQIINEPFKWHNSGVSNDSHSLTDQFTTLRPTKCTILFVTCLYYITLNIPTCFDLQGIIIGESNPSNTAQNQTSKLSQ